MFLHRDIVLLAISVALIIKDDSTKINSRLKIKLNISDIKNQ